jgi:hypothetical protein
MGIDPDKITNPRFRAALEAAEAPLLPVPLKAPGTPGPVPTGKRKRSPKTPEITIHDQIVAFCDRNGIVPVHPDPSRKSSIRTGYPDFFCCRDAHVMGLEIKVPPNTLSKAQQYEFPRIQACGVPISLCIETSAGAALTQATESLCMFFKIKSPL